MYGYSLHLVRFLDAAATYYGSRFSTRPSSHGYFWSLFTLVPGTTRIAVTFVINLLAVCSR